MHIRSNIAQFLAHLSHVTNLMVNV